MKQAGMPRKTQHLLSPSPSGCFIMNSLKCVAQSLQRETDQCDWEKLRSMADQSLLLQGFADYYIVRMLSNKAAVKLDFSYFLKIS